jgi:Tfp pilus assembly protein PilX
MPRKRNAADRRGLAMMMVLVSLALATILASAYLASRDNSLVIGRNSTATARARWAALSALETAVAVLQTETDWRNSHTNGVLLDSYPLAGATITITARDMETDAPPTDTSEYVELTATASVDVDNDGRADGVQETKIEAYVPRVAGNRVAIDLAEFAIFVEDDIILSDSTTVARWATAPLSHLGRRIHLGTQATASSSVDVRDTAACIDTTVYYQTGASSSLVANATGFPIMEVEQPFEIPFRLGPGPGVPDPDSPTPPDLRPSAGDSVTINSDERFDDIVVEDAQLTLQGDITVVCDDLLEIDDQSKCYIDGNVTLIAFGDFEVKDDSFIELLDGATLTVFVGDDIEIRNGYIGELRPDNDRDHTGNAPYMDPLRIRIYSIDHAAVDTHYWLIRLNSVVKGSIYGHPVELRVYDQSSVYGRVAVHDVRFTGNAGLFYDHALDEQQGYTNPDSLLIDGSTGDLDSAFLGLTWLDPTSLQALADATETVIHANGTSIAPTTSAPVDPPLPGDPTPRPVLVTYELTTFGMDMGQWERANADPAVPDGGGGGGGGGKQQVN